MYIVKRNGKKSFRRTFDTYEEARIAIRKHIRKTDDRYDPFLDLYSNPNLSTFGFSIKKVEGTFNTVETYLELAA